ncbi:DNA polymerase epsilon subunit 4 [Alligator sinensis]|uniref:DNA polymerase epsilon subunit 4 n=1 Tax=Alligator sinensis TaxID=38654 RepID=A0A3Q0GW63_ALLSI|nr:DNA polymerase epsilon subunit 4 [Alligator sinensis]
MGQHRGRRTGEESGIHPRERGAWLCAHPREELGYLCCACGQERSLAVCVVHAVIHVGVAECLCGEGLQVDHPDSVQPVLPVAWETVAHWTCGSCCPEMELFVETIAKDAYVYAQQGKRKTLQRKDLDNAIEAIDEFAFLEGTLD